MKLIFKVLLGLAGVVVILAISAWVYFGSGSETYPNGLSVGNVAPTFANVDQYGNTQHLDSLTTNSDVVLVFFRGTWCPQCNQHIAAMNDSLDMIQDKGARVVLITPEKPDFAGENEIKTSVDIPIIHDENLDLMNKYDVAYDMSLGSQRLFNTFGVDFNELYGNEGKLPLPATYIIGKDRIIKYANTGVGGMKVNYATVKQVLAAL